MKRQQMVICVLSSLLMVTACSGQGGNTVTTPSAAFSSATATATIKAEPVNPETEKALIAAASIKPENIENKAGIANEKTLVISLTGSASCRPTPDVITLQKDSLQILLKEQPADCPSDLTTTLWKIDLPDSLVPRTKDLNVTVVAFDGLILPLVAKAQ